MGFFLLKERRWVFSSEREEVGGGVFLKEREVFFIEKGRVFFLKKLEWVIFETVRERFFKKKKKKEREWVFS